jgi:thioredoxin reductase (NADPH)
MGETLPFKKNGRPARKTRESRSLAKGGPATATTIHAAVPSLMMLESSLPGVFAIGDVRAGSVKRVAAAVGAGAVSVSMLHRALAEL